MKWWQLFWLSAYVVLAPHLTMGVAFFSGTILFLTGCIYAAKGL